MTEAALKLRAVLDGYANFLKDRQLALPKHRPHLVRWVREFLLFAQAHLGFTFEQARDLFLEAINKGSGIQPWQIRQAADAILIYRYQFRRAHDAAGPEPVSGSLSLEQVFSDGEKLTRLCSRQSRG